MKMLTLAKAIKSKEIAYTTQWKGKLLHRQNSLLHFLFLSHFLLAFCAINISNGGASVTTHIFKVEFSGEKRLQHVDKCYSLFIYMYVFYLILIFTFYVEPTQSEKKEAF